MDKLPEHAAACNTNLSTYQSAADDSYLPAPDVVKRYRVTHMTLWRWLKDDKIAFPKPLYIGKRRYFRIADLTAWETEQANKGGAA